MLLYRPGHPKAINGKYVYRYRLVVEESIWRFLLPTETVHHINGNKSDDRLENLRIETATHHMHVHERQRVIERRGYDPNTHKQCRLCHEVKPRDCFSPTCKAKPHKRSSACKACCCIEQRARRMKANGRLPKET